MPLREEAIDLHLQRYGANEPEIYETIFRIEMVLFSHKQEQEKKRKEKEEKERKAKQKTSRARTTPPPRRRR